MRATAMRRATELRLAQREIDALEASRRLERVLSAWREDGDELPLRQRIAALRMQGGDARGALEMLRETATVFPEHAAALRRSMSDAFMEALRSDTPLNAVVMHDSQPDLMPTGPEGDAAAALLAQRLASLDLAERAQAVLQSAIQRAGSPERRANLGAELAALELAENSASAALRTLDASAAPNLPAELQRRREVLAARAEARRSGGGTAALAALGADGEEALAESLAATRDFAGAAAALGRHIDRSMANGAPLAPALMRSIVRHAALLALAGDTGGLARARQAYGPALAGTPAEAPFRLLTTDPVRGLADLPRIQNELELFRAMPSRLDGLRTAEAPAR